MTPAIVVVSLASASDRRQRLSDMMARVGLSFEFFDALDGDDALALSNAYACRPDLLTPSYECRRKPISGRELACTISHLRAIRHVWLKREARPLLVLEDDAMFCIPDKDLLLGCLSKAPTDAAYLQLAVLPGRTVEALAENFASGGDLFVAKSSNHRVQTARGEMGCHCAAAYFLSEASTRTIAERWFLEGKALLPCREDQLSSNVNLVGDRFVYSAATSAKGTGGYVCAAPLATTAALDSQLHADHLPWHAEARDMASIWSARLEMRLRASLPSMLSGRTVQSC